MYDSNSDGFIEYGDYHHDVNDETETECSDETETTDHSVEELGLESASDDESEQEYQTTFTQEEQSKMPTKYLSKRQRRNVRRCLHEIVQNHQTGEAYISSVPRQVNYKPAPRNQDHGG